MVGIEWWEMIAESHVINKVNGLALESSMMKNTINIWQAIKLVDMHFTDSIRHIRVKIMNE